MTPRPFWQRDRYQDRRALLQARARITKHVRAWFERQDFVEVETAALQISPGNEAHLHAFRTEFRPDGAGAPTALYLHTSPEFACKKLLAAGEDRIVTFARAFRNREIGPLHHPEFTMLEWYRAHAPYTQMMADCADILALAADVVNAREINFRGRTCDSAAPPRRISLREAFAVYADINLDATYVDGVPATARFVAEAQRIGERTAPDDTWSDVFSRILATRIEPHLGQGRAAILYEYPTHEAALARPCPHDGRVAERFELYVCGVELANCFGELTDGAEQRRRFEAEMAEKYRVYGERYPIDEDFLAALAVMPPASGAALGFDRLVMLVTGATRIDDVIWTPVAIPPRD